MLVTPPKCQSARNETRSRGRTKSLTRALRLGAVLAVLAGPTQRGWSQSQSRSGSESQSSAIYFVASRERYVETRAKETPVPASVINQPTYEPPITIADYETGVKTDWIVPDLATRLAPPPAPQRTAAVTPPATTLKPVHPFAAVESGKMPSQSVAAPLSRDIDFAELLVPTCEAARAASNDLPMSHSIAPPIPIRESENYRAVASAQPASRTVAPAAPNRASEMNIAEASVLPIVEAPAPNKPQGIGNFQPPSSGNNSTSKSDGNRWTAQSLLKVIRESHVSMIPTRITERPAVVLAQAPEMPKPLSRPAEPKIESPPLRTEPIPMAAANGSPVPMTTSNFLPANPEESCFRCGVKCPPCGCNPGGPGWAASRPIPWEVFAQGEYVGPSRLAHVPIYRLRVDDQLAFVYYLSGQVSGQPYRLNVRDRIQVQSLSAPEVVNREVIVEPDGTVTLPLLGQVRASGATLAELRKQLDEQFKSQIKDPRITVTPLVMNSNLEELRSSVDRRYGQGGQVSTARVSPDGTIQLPAIGAVPAQGLTIEELEREIKARYALVVEGLEVTPILTDRAPRFVYVVGEVRLPGRFAMEGPTTLMQAIALAGSWNVGAQLNDVIVFRRDENWQLMATKVNIRASLLFKKPCPAGEIWLRDSDIVLVPKSPILCADDVINLVFTRGIYGVFPMSATLNFAKLSSL